ncbi:hypothetical protein ABZV60_19715 [Streptomyces sp. NPDC004787]|uniref:hypothetical protein n=1 Tax=Streptomyces sp. NPDC004787 TaxID=3154291 RepID=UPI0033AEF8B6
MKGTQLERYATLRALGEIRIGATRMKQAGMVRRSELRAQDTTVTALDLSAKTPKATLTTCVDLSAYETYHTRTNKPVPLPSNQPLRYVSTVLAEKWPNGWMITDINQNGAQPC